MPDEGGQKDLDGFEDSSTFSRSSLPAAIQQHVFTTQCPSTTVTRSELMLLDGTVSFYYTAVFTFQPLFHAHLWSLQSHTHCGTLRVVQITRLLVLGTTSGLLTELQ